MIDIKKIKLFPFIVRNQILAVPNTDDKPYNLIIYPENMSFQEVYEKLQIKRIFVRKIVLALSPFLKLFRSKALIDEYRKRSLIIVPNIHTVKDNVYIDTSHIFEKLEKRYKPGNYRRRNLIQFINNYFNQFTENTERTNVLLYCIDLHKDFNSNIFGRRSFPLLFDLYQNKDFKYDYVLLVVFKDNKPYYLAVKNKIGVVPFARLRSVLNNLKRIKDEIKPEDEIHVASNILTDEIESALPSEEESELDKEKPEIKDTSEKEPVDKQQEKKEKIKSAIKTYLKDKPDLVKKILNKSITKGEAYAIATKAIIRNATSATEEQAHNTIESEAITDDDKKELLQKVTNKLVKDIIKKKTLVNNSTHIVTKNIPILKINENKEPSHLLNKRFQDFSEVFGNDLRSVFKILENRQPTLKLKSIKATPIEITPGDLNPSLMTNYKIVLTDERKKDHEIEIQIPTIQSDGSFLINGRKKYLIFQILLDPIFFLRKDIAKLESTYAAISVHLRETRHKSYFMCFISGCVLPLFALLAYNFGFEHTCKMFKISYKLSEKKNDDAMYELKLADDNYMDFTFDMQNRAAFLLLESIKQFPTMFSSTNFKDPHYYGELIIEITKNRNSLYTINEVLHNILDPICIQILRARIQPTKLDEIFFYICHEMSKGRVDDRNDINHQRIRTSEVFIQQIHNLMLQAYNSYRIKNISGDKSAKFFLDTRRVVQEILNSQLMREVENINPIEELSCLTRITPVGIGGISDTNAVSDSSRNIHSSYYGNIDSMDTPENANVGVINQLTVDAFVASNRGLFVNKEHIKDDKAGILSVNSALIPFVNSTDGCRVMFSGSQGRQTIPIEGNEPPLVQTGYESILANMLSDNYIKKALDNGIVTKIDKDVVLIKLNNGRIQKVPLEFKVLRSGQGQNSISIFNPVVKVNDRVKKDQLIAEGSLMKDGMISQGANLLSAIMLWKGYSFEDGYIISETVAGSKFASNSFHEIEVLIKKDDRISFLSEEGLETRTGEPLMIRSSRVIESLINVDIDEIEEGRIVTKSPGGKLISIEIYPNVSLKNYEVLQPQYEKFKAKYIKQYGHFPTKFKAQLYSSTNEEFPGILIKFKILQREQCELGDKITNNFGGKGVLALIEKEQNMPMTPFGERVELILNPLAIINRMNPSTIKEMYLGLIMKSFSKLIVSYGEMKNPKALNLVRQLFTALDNTKDRIYSTQLISTIESMNPKVYTFMIQDIKKRNFYFPVLIPPFQEPQLAQIYNAMKIVGVKSSYYLTLPEWNIKTKNPVACGYIYYKKLEQQSGIKMSARSTGGMINMVTGQSYAGKKISGGQRIGEMDSWSIINHGATHVLKELFGPLSDDLVTKNEIINEIIQNGSANYRDPKISPTRDMLKAYLQGLMLDSSLK